MSPVDMSIVALSTLCIPHSDILVRCHILNGHKIETSHARTHREISAIVKFHKCIGSLIIMTP